MGPRSTVRIGRPLARQRPRPWGAIVLVALVLLIGATLGLRWYWHRATFAWSVQRGAALLAAAADTPDATRAALDEWERATSGHWRTRREDFITYLCSKQSLADAHARLLLTRVAGADFGDRVEDWKHWCETRERLRRGEPPKLTARQRVEMLPKWTAPVGLTAWFTTVIPLGGQIYVASLGSAFEDPDDTSDGVVRVDGKSGQAELMFSPPDGPLRDVMGIAAGDECLFVSTRAGWVYCIDPKGALRWKVRSGTVLGGAPLSLDVNRDGISDAVVVTSDHKVVAYSGQNGHTLWTTALASRGAPPPEARNELGAALAAGRVMDEAHLDLLATLPTGEVRVLASRNGEVRWKSELAAGSIAGPLVCSGLLGDGPPAYIGDGRGMIWSLIRSGNSLKAVPTCELTWRESDGLMAALRTTLSDERPPTLIACPSGHYDAGNASVCAVDSAGLRWRYPTGGGIWSTPVLADLNGDKESELVVASIENDAAGQPIGVVSILSAHGQCLRRMPLSAPIECSPVVADVDGDGRMDVLIADQAGWLHCFDTRQVIRAEWCLFGGDSHNTRNAENAFRYAQRSADMQWSWHPE